MTILRILVLLVACACPLTAARPDHAPDGGATRQRNVIFVIADGVRWQEVFRGADTDMMTTANGVTRNREDLLRRFDAETTAARRERLMPFLWTHVARGGSCTATATSEARCPSRTGTGSPIRASASCSAASRTTSA